MGEKKQAETGLNRRSNLTLVSYVFYLFLGVWGGGGWAGAGAQVGSDATEA